MDERKPIDYIHEPDRQEILDLYQRLERIYKKIIMTKNQLKSKPNRISTTSDLITIFEMFELLYASLLAVNTQLNILYTRYYKDKT